VSNYYPKIQNHIKKKKTNYEIIIIYWKKTIDLSTFDWTKNVLMSWVISHAFTVSNLPLKIKRGVKTMSWMTKKNYFEQSEETRVVTL